MTAITWASLAEACAYDPGAVPEGRREKEELSGSGGSKTEKEEQDALRSQLAKFNQEKASLGASGSEVPEHLLVQALMSNDQSALRDFGCSQGSGMPSTTRKPRTLPLV